MAPDTSPANPTVLVYRAGMWHIIDTVTRCAIITMGEDSKMRMVGDAQAVSYPQPIHTYAGTLG